MNSETKLFIAVVSGYLVLIAAIYHTAFGIVSGGDDIASCNDPICANSINRDIANEEIMNQTDMTHHSVMMWPKLP